MSEIVVSSAAFPSAIILPSPRPDPLFQPGLHSVGSVFANLETNYTSSIFNTHILGHSVLLAIFEIKYSHNSTLFPLFINHFLFRYGRIHAIPSGPLDKPFLPYLSTRTLTLSLSLVSAFTIAYSSLARSLNMG